MDMLIVEFPVHAHFDVLALHRVAGGGDVAVVDESGDQVAAAHEEGGPLDAQGEMRAR